MEVPIGNAVSGVQTVVAISLLPSNRCVVTRNLNL